MDSKNILNKIMTMLSIDKSPVSLSSGDLYGKLEDGTIIVAHVYEVGQPLFVVTEEGRRVAAPDGDHVAYLATQNGSKRYLIQVKDSEITRLELADNHKGIVDKVNYENDPELILKDKNMVNKSTQNLAAMGPDVPGEVTTNDEAQVVKEMEDKGSVSMADGDVASRLDALGAELKSLRDDIATLFEHLKGGSEEMKKYEMAEGADKIGQVTSNDEESIVKDFQKKGSSMQGAPNYGGPVKASAQKKFTGAPVEAKQASELQGIVSLKTKDTFSTVLSRMSRF
jgi:hypothetical protein